MINRLKAAKRKEHKLKIEKLIKKQIDHSQNMVNRTCVKENELVYKKILKKEIENKKFRDYEEQMHNLFRFNTIKTVYHNIIRADMLKVYLTNWNTIMGLVGPMVEAFNCLGKKYPLSNRLARDIIYRFVKDTNFVKNLNPQPISEMVNTFGKYLMEIDDIFAMAVLSFSYQLNRPELIYMALDKLSEYEISSDAIDLIGELKEDIIARHLEGFYEFSSMEKIWKILILCYGNRAQVVQYISMHFSLDNLSLEIKTFLLENGFSDLKN